ncbi:MAG TPA: hypothetical protein VMX16_03045 [Terriglobia bacterium]|nr:hypothetical protein [Terriglobia bacterium]
MDWSQLSLGAIAGSAGTWLLGVLKTLFEHLLEQRRQRAAEESVIRAEQREEERKATERKQTEADRVKEDEATLLMYKTQLRGCTELFTAARVVGGIHSYFIQRPQYLGHSANAGFLEKYPGNLHDQVCVTPDQFGPNVLDELKRAVEALQVRPNADN